MSLRRRLEALEGQDTDEHGVSVLLILGGLPDQSRKVATAGEHRWLQDSGESDNAFRDRAVSLSEINGESFVIIGGLPSD